MGVLQSIFFRPARGYREYDETSVGYGGVDGGSSTIWTPSDTLYQLDGVIKEQHTSTVKLTKHPVEFGVDLTDHSIKQPQKVIVEGIVTNSPSLKQLLNRLPGSESLISASSLTDIVKGSRARNAYAGLIELQNKRMPVQLQTGLLQYDNMVLTSVSAPSDIQDNLRVRLVFDEVFIIDGSGTGVIQAVTTTPNTLDVATALASLTSVGVAGIAAESLGDS